MKRFREKGDDAMCFKKMRRRHVIKLSLGSWFNSQEELRNGLIDFYTKEGEQVQAYDEESIILNGKRYFISKRTHAAGYFIYQEQRLTEADWDDE